ncbi:DgyrCDS11786 [Dimorphilus gyrociliatus]|uniref:DgyrCDS11786 n=1 Tax=Dimorphilus gyrociliatus TaxID=2664684 RepID=A0A7I8W705_9ANNE|nr:DgyrCDS11786 [Dimorphilus gyrociliatus]
MPNWEFHDPKPIVRIYIPYECMNAPTGNLIGWSNRKTRIICVTGIVRNGDVRSIRDWLRESKLSEGFGYSIRQLGVWFRNDDLTVPSIISSYIVRFEIVACRKKDDVPIIHLSPVWDCSEAMVILYSAEYVQQSALLMQSAADWIDDGENATKLMEGTHVNQLSRALHLQQKVSQKCNISLDVIDTSSCMLKPWKIRALYNAFTYLLYHIFSIVFWVPRCLFRLEECIKNSILKRIILLTFVGKNLLEHYQGFQSLKKYDINNPLCTLRLLNYSVRRIIDIVVGICTIYFLKDMFDTEKCSDELLLVANSIVEHLRLLIKWLMGSPAGLKLNYQLSHFLGTFFLYHFYLWMGYLNLIKPWIAMMLNLTLWIGVLGVSYQISFCIDIFNMMTLHIYCFYVYASRLYKLQMKGVSSLFLLFRGKKKNVLRKRIDTLSCDVDTLFVGTLFFCIILFLFPTVLTYYAVFTLLRLLVLIVQFIPQQFVMFLNRIPFYSFLLKMIRSKTVMGKFSTRTSFVFL